MISSYDVWIDLVNAGIKSTHKDLVRTIKRFLTHGMEDEIIESYFINKMGRKYTMYLLSDRVANMIDCIYIFKGYGDIKDNNKKTDYKKPDLTYIISSSNGTYKIGCTNDINGRIKAIQTGNPDFLELYCFLYGGKEIEMELHKIFSEFRINGEWFNINEHLIHKHIYMNDRYRLIFNYASTLNSILLDFYHYGDSQKELSIKNFTNSTNSRILNKIKKSIQDGMNRKLPYKEIYRYAKEEVEKLSDSLAFKRIEKS